MKERKILIGILLVASLFRLLWLTKSPPSLNWDEVSIGYNAYSILKTGRDEWGKLLPLSFKAYGEHKLPAMIYASVPGIALFGLTDFGVRITPALIGIIAVYLMYLLGKEIAGAKVGYIASALMAISPWHVHISRASFEAGLGLVFLECAVLLLMRAKTKRNLLPWSALAGVLAIYSYNSARVVVPALAFAYLYQRKDWLKHNARHVTIAAVLAFALIVPIVKTVGESKVRWSTLNLWQNEGFYADIGQARIATPLPSPLPRLIHNKYTHLAHTVFRNYLKTYSTSFLFFDGSANTQRSSQGLGLLYLFEIPLLAVGIAALARNKTYTSLILPWLFIAPIPSALTIDAPDSLRALSALPAILLTTALGAERVIEWFKKRSLFIRILAVAFVTWNILHFTYRLFGVYPRAYASDWQYGYKQTIVSVMEKYEEADKIYITTAKGEPYMYVLFYGRIDPRAYQDESNVRRSQDPTGWVHVDAFDKFEFVNLTSEFYKPEIIAARAEGSILIVGEFGDIPGKYPTFVTTRAPDGELMFEGSFIEKKEGAGLEQPVVSEVEP